MSRRVCFADSTSSRDRSILRKKRCCIESWVFCGMVEVEVEVEVKVEKMDVGWMCILWRLDWACVWEYGISLA